MEGRNNTIRNDLRLLFVLCLMGALLGGMLLFTRQKGELIVVRVDGEQRSAFLLSGQTRYEIEGVGGKNILIIESGSAWLEDADCPDRLCVRQGKISHVGESIICLPHRTVIEVVGSQSSTPDAVSGRG